ncbi:MAG: amidase family protein [Caulobacterales bacterium]
MLKSRSIDYATSTAGALVQALARREVSAVELHKEAVAAIEAKDKTINAVVVRDFDRALLAAKAADAALARGEARPLLGLPMTVKESNQMAGLPCTWGLEAFKGVKADEDAVGIARLKGAGAVILGATNVPPNLGDWQAANPVYGRTNNPHDLTRSPGGSSGGGAAALASGMVPLEYGSDIGGSIRIPAHFCGVFGHKPSWNLIPLTGHQPPGTPKGGPPFMLAVVGPLARTASDLDLALSVLAGPEEATPGFALAPPRAERMAGLRVLVLDRHPSAGVDGEVLKGLESVASAMAGAGAKVVRAPAGPELPDLALAHAGYGEMLGAVLSAGVPDAPQVTPETWRRLVALQESVRDRWAAVFETVDVVIAPPFGTAAFPHTDEADWSKRRLIIDGEATPYGVQLAWPGMATFANLPATVVPAGKTREGLPVGVQIIGPFMEDRTTIAVAGMVEQLLDA